MASNPPVEISDDVDSPLAVVVDRSGTPASTCNDGDVSPGVVGSPGLDTNNIAQSNIDGVFHFERLPVELQNKIIGFAMTAKNRQIIFACLTNAAFKPNITVGLFLVNHRIYHEAYYQLRKQNILVFSNFGSDLKTVVSSIGPLKCRSGACGYGPLKSMLANVVFAMGDESLPESARDTIYAFGCALRQLRSPIIVRTLHIGLAYHSFKHTVQLSDFASALSVVKVQEKLIIDGDGLVLTMGFSELPRKLGLYVLPVYTDFQAYTNEPGKSPGSFIHEYIPESRLSEDTRKLAAKQTSWSL